MRASSGQSERRLADLEARIDRLERRLLRLEAKSTPQASEGGGVSESAPTPDAGVEYFIGAKLLPRAGAVLIVLSIAFVVILQSSQSQAVDRTLLLLAEALLCLGFIVAGEWKRDEAEGFGFTLSAIGSTGLYLTAAGGHFAYHEITAATMAFGFAALTLANHAYAVWRRTRLFFFIGALGGLAGMVFPLVQKDYGTVLAVYLTVTVAGAVACAIRKWFELAIVGWFMGLLVLAPVIDSDFPRVSVLVALYSGSLACIGAATHAFSGWSWDRTAVGAAVTTLTSALIGQIVLPGRWALAHEGLFALGGVLTALTVPKQNPARRSLLIGALASAALLGPISLTPLEASLSYSAVAVAAWALGGVGSARWAAAFSVAGFFLAAFSFARGVASSPTKDLHAMLAGLVVALIFSTVALRRARSGWISYSVAGSWGLLSLWAWLLEPAAHGGSAPFSSLALASTAYAVLLMAIGFKLRSPTLRFWSFAVTLVSVGEVALFSTGTSAVFRLALLATQGGLMIVGGYLYSHGSRAGATPNARPQPEPSRNRLIR